MKPNYQHKVSELIDKIK